MKKAKIILLLLVATMAKGQTSFKLNGLGRAVLSNDKLNGNVLTNDTVSASKAAGGYTIFDLGANVKSGDQFYANTILRARNEFGLFYGAGATFNFRQLTLGGKITKNFGYEVGDVDIAMTPFTVHNFEDSYHTFESDVFALKRAVAEYENFVSDNNWRLQGIKGNGFFDLSEKLRLYVITSAFRTNTNNNIDVSDRILSANQFGLGNGKGWRVNLNHAGIFQIPIDNYLVDFNNHVFTADGSYALSSLPITIKAEGGISDYSFEDVASDTTNIKTDFFYSIGAKGKFNRFVVGLNYRDVGPQFTSPAAQTRRININATPVLFPNVMNNTATRSLGNFDRFSEEGVYNRKISPTLYDFNPAYSNFQPFGLATPNRRTVELGVQTDTSVKVVNAELKLVYSSEIVSDRVADNEKRKFLVATGGFNLNLDKLLGLKRKLVLKAGSSYENTTRSGLGVIDLKSTTIDAGLQVEVIKNTSLLVGYKSINAKGNEFISQRNKFNELVDANPTTVNYDFKEQVLALGAQLKFGKYSWLSANYYLVDVSNALAEATNYSINQLYFNYTLKF